MNDASIRLPAAPPGMPHSCQDGPPPCGRRGAQVCPAQLKLVPKAALMMSTGSGPRSMGARRA